MKTYTYLTGPSGKHHPSVSVISGVNQLHQRSQQNLAGQNTQLVLSANKFNQLSSKHRQGCV
jgi:hypothetical protein